MYLQAPESARLEVKFISKETDYFTILNWINLHNMGFIEHHPQRCINNIYYDTQHYTSLENNLSGESSRLKVRYRWYSENTIPDIGTLEVKCKRNFFGWKLSYNTKSKIYEPNFTLKTFNESLLEALPDEAKKWIYTYPTPVILNQYTRRYFVSFDERIRVTLDTKLKVWDQRYKPYLNNTREANLHPVMVMEVKFSRKDRELASKFIHGLPLRVSRHSKYVNGLLAIATY